MTRENPSPNLGGVRPGAGRPRSYIRLRLPVTVYRQYEEVAATEQVEIEAVVREALLDWIERWQSAHDTSPTD